MVLETQIQKRIATNSLGPYPNPPEKAAGNKKGCDPEEVAFMPYPEQRHIG